MNRAAILLFSAALIVAPDIAAAQDRGGQRDGGRPGPSQGEGRPGGQRPPSGGPGANGGHNGGRPDRPNPGRPETGLPNPGRPDPGRPNPGRPEIRRPVRPPIGGDRPGIRPPVGGRPGPGARPPQYRPGMGRPPQFRPIHGSAFRYPPGFRYRRWSVGLLLPSLFLGSNYYYDSYRDLGVGAPPPGCRWVRYGPDLLLVDVRTRRVVDVIYGAFY
jgi:Ni/Co efflux regulator RcnB